MAGRKADLAAVSALLEKEDFEAIRTLGHNMKGSGASHGLPEISRIGEYMEAAAIRRDESSVGLFTQDLLRLMETIQCGLLRRQLRVDSCRDAIEAA